MSPKKHNFSVYRDDGDVIVKGTNVNLRCQSWAEMELNRQLVSNINQCGYIWPRKIQEAVIPYVFRGQDILCQSETGTGKTAAYLIPLIDEIIRLKASYKYLNNGPFCIIIAPTREFVQQIAQDAIVLAKRTGINVATAYGGGNVRVKQNLSQLSHGCDILCATIGRLLNLMDHDYWDFAHLNLENLSHLVIDEADHFLMGSGFHDILSFFGHQYFTPVNDECQKLFFSSTLQLQRLRNLAKKHCNVKNPTTFVTSCDSNKRIKYEIDLVPSGADKYTHLKNRILDITQKQGGWYPRILIFVNNKKTANLLAENLNKNGIPTAADHSDYHQSYRDKVLSDFRRDIPQLRIIVVVNICSRGIDILDMDYVINYDIPLLKETFIQRCGRTGRIKNGVAISLYVESSDARYASYIKEVLQEAQQDVPHFLQNYSRPIYVSMANLSLRNQRGYRY